MLVLGRSGLLLPLLMLMLLLLTLVGRLVVVVGWLSVGAVGSVLLVADLSSLMVAAVLLLLLLRSWRLEARVVAVWLFGSRSAWLDAVDLAHALAVRWSELVVHLVTDGLELAVVVGCVRCVWVERVDAVSELVQLGLQLAVAQDDVIQRC